MPRSSELIKKINSSATDSIFAKLYGSKNGVVEYQKTRYTSAVEKFVELYGDNDNISVFSTPGRTEVGGNHTDHNHGKVLAASVNLDTVAVAAKCEGSLITIKSEGFPQDIIYIDLLEPVEEEKFKSAALIRGVCSRLNQLGYKIGGFNAYTTSNVLKGSGLSSSAAFEVLIVTILSNLYNDGVIDAVEAAQISQYAENEFFGKPCGLMDQTACSVGGFVTIDFENPEKPKAKRINFDFENCGYTLVITDTGGNHANLNAEYAAVTEEMRETAEVLGGKYLREFSKADIMKNLRLIRGAVNDRAVLRALHFYNDNERVEKEVEYLEKGDIFGFLHLVNESGSSSWRYLQNCYTSNATEQSVTLGLAVSEQILAGRGACRVHGGGFAGTIQAFVPNDILDDYLKGIRTLFGESNCYELMIRPEGSIKLNF